MSTASYFKLQSTVPSFDLQTVQSNYEPSSEIHSFVSLASISSLKSRITIRASWLLLFNSWSSWYRHLIIYRWKIVKSIILKDVALLKEATIYCSCNWFISVQLVITFWIRIRLSAIIHTFFTKNFSCFLQPSWNDVLSCIPHYFSILGRDVYFRCFLESLVLIH